MNGRFWIFIFKYVSQIKKYLWYIIFKLCEYPISFVTWIIGLPQKLVWDIKHEAWFLLFFLIEVF